jgi:arylsulfatase A-like enzyme
MDEQVGRMMEALRGTAQDQNTIVIFTSDHGLAMGSHGLMGKQNMYDHTIGVPLVMAGPGVPKNRRSAAQTYLRDLYPTVCELAGIAIPDTVEGRSLVPVLSGRAREIYPEIYAYWHRADYSASLPIQRMVRTERWKLIYYSHLNRYQLFDLDTDPHELRDLSWNSENQTVMAELRRKLEAWFGPRIEPFNAASLPRKRS